MQEQELLDFFTGGGALHSLETRLRVLFDALTYVSALPELPTNFRVLLYKADGACTIRHQDADLSWDPGVFPTSLQCVGDLIVAAILGTRVFDNFIVAKYGSLQECLDDCKLAYSEFQHTGKLSLIIRCLRDPIYRSTLSTKAVIHELTEVARQTLLGHATLQQVVDCVRNCQSRLQNEDIQEDADSDTSSIPQADAL